MKKLCLTFLTLLLVVTGFSASVLAADGQVSYTSHIQELGWEENYKTAGDISGTTGMGLALEGVKIRVEGATGLGVSYQAHVQDIGWQDPVSDDTLAGTEGQAKRLEALRISLTGDNKDAYDLYYRVHAAGFGWLGWAKNGESAGSEGCATQIEAVQIELLSKGAPAPGDVYGAFKTHGDLIDLVGSENATALQSDMDLTYSVYLNPSGWAEAVNGQELGGVDHVEQICVGLSPELYNHGGIIYRVYNNGNGWSDWNSNGNPAGAAGQSVSAIRVKLTSQLQYQYDLYYRVHTLGMGWSNFGMDGQSVGSEGFSRSISHIQIMLRPKGSYPGPIGNCFEQGKWAWPVPGHTGISSYFGPRWGSHHDGVDIPAPSGTPIVSCKDGIVLMAGPDGNLGNCVAVENDSGEAVYYAHMVRVGCTVGQRVHRGEVIGYVGTTGHSTGNHLHLEMYTDTGDLVNGLPYIR